MKTNIIVHFPKLQKRKWLTHFLKNVTTISNRTGLTQRAFQISGVVTSSLGAKMANVSRRISFVMVTLHVKMNQTRTIVNALPTGFVVSGKHAS